MGFDFKNYKFDIESVIDDEIADVKSDLESAVGNVVDDYFSYGFYDRFEEALEQAFNDGYEEAEQDCEDRHYDETYKKGVEDTIKVISEGLKDYVFNKLGLITPVEEVSPEVQIENAIAEHETL